MNECIAFTGGGTAGHVFPALAVLEELEGLWGGRVFWIGSLGGMEREIVRGHGVPYVGIPSGKLRRYLSLRNFLDLFAVGLGVLVCLFVLLRRRPSVLFSKGGYVSVPPVVAAWLLRIPVLTHESDLNPGLATRINARFADSVLVSFPESAAYLARERRARVVHTGNPLRRALLQGEAEKGRRLAGCRGEQPLLLVLGGSQGSAFINRLIEESLQELTAACRVVHQMGGAHFRPAARPDYLSAPFFGEELPHLLAAADLVVCRAGANTLWELAALGKPALLIPLAEHASRGDQLENARYFESRGAAAVMEERGLTGKALADRVLRLLVDRPALQEMSRRAAALSRPDSARTIARLLAEKNLRIGSPDAV